MNEKDELIFKIIEKSNPIHIDSLYNKIFNKGIYQTRYYIKKSLKRLESFGRIKVQNFRVEILSLEK